MERGTDLGDLVRAERVVKAGHCGVDLCRVTEAHEDGGVRMVVECVPQGDVGEGGGVVAEAGAKWGESGFELSLALWGEHRVGAAMVVRAEHLCRLGLVVAQQESLAESLFDQHTDTVTAGEGEDVGLLGRVERAEQVVSHADDGWPDCVDNRNHRVIASASGRALLAHCSANA